MGFDDNDFEEFEGIQETQFLTDDPQSEVAQQGMQGQQMSGNQIQGTGQSMQGTGQPMQGMGQSMQANTQQQSGSQQQRPRGNPQQMRRNAQRQPRGRQPMNQQAQNFDPNIRVQQPQNRPNINYNQQAQSGARQARTEEMNQGYSQPGQTIQRNAQGQPVYRQQQMQSNPQQRQSQQQQRVPMGQVQQQYQNNNMNQQYNQTQQYVDPMVAQQPPRKRGFGKILGVVAVLAVVIGAVGLLKSGVINLGSQPEAKVEDYNKSGKKTLDDLLVLLNAETFDAKAIDALIGAEEGDSFIAQEWAYINGVKLREEFVQKVCRLVKFEYPQVSQKSTTGADMTDKSGQPVMVESMMNNGESVTVTIPDYNAITEMMGADNEDTGKGYVVRMFKSSKYSEKDYTWNDELANLLMQYLCDLPELPTKTVQINIPVSGGLITDDSQLDDVLFGSDEFHQMCAKYSQICLGWTGYKSEKYKAKEEKHNPEYDKWLDLFLKYYTKDGGRYNPKTGKFSGGKFHKATSKWEPWYLRDDKDNFIRDEKGRKIVNYYSVKKKDGTDWIQPSETVLVTVTKTRQVEDPWVEETGIQYNVVGTNWIQNNYQGVGDTAFRVGDGSKDAPAGIGTTIITKALCTDGKYHDVKVAVVGYWLEQDAIDYAEKFSTKNRGFTTDSVKSFITYEIQIENLESKTITLADSEMSLCDDNSNISSRTGTMYGFTENLKIKSREKILINDWAVSTELDQKYVIWGKDFGRTYPMVYFMILAGTGEVPSYSAYKQFTGQSTIDENVNIEQSEGEQSGGADDAYQKALEDLGKDGSGNKVDDDTSTDESGGTANQPASESNSTPAE